jgi:hypothetical protein
VPVSFRRLPPNGLPRGFLRIQSRSMLVLLLCHGSFLMIMSLCIIMFCLFRRIWERVRAVTAVILNT